MNEETLFHLALQKTAEERAAFLDEACAGDPDLRQRLEILLRAHEKRGNLLDKPPVDPALTIDSNKAGRRPRSTADFVGSADSPATWIGPYKLLRTLGEGGMGAVYLAEQEQPIKRRVALKIIKAGLDSAQVMARFEQERQALALMDHPNIAKVYDAGAWDEGLSARPYFVMELVQGISITKYCDQEHLTPKQRLELFIPVCQAVQHAHQKGVIHRDLKPSNVLIGLYDGKPIAKVIDFGVAKATAQKLTERTMFTEVGQIVGTLEYMAPEQAELSNLDIDTRADIYSLGVILYELLTGSPPFTSKELRGAAFSEMLRMIREVEPARPSTRLSSSDQLPSIAANRKLEPKKLTQMVHGELDWIVMKCLEKERTRRYETANQLSQDIERYLHDEPVLAGPPSKGYRLRKFLRRNRGPVIAASLLLLALLGGIAGTTGAMLRAFASEADAVDAKHQSDEDRKVAEARRIDAEKAEQKEREAAKIAKERQIAAELAEEKERQARKEVEQSLAKVKAIQDYLLRETLAASDPEREFRRNVTVKEALDRAAAKIDLAFKKQPEVEAAVRETIGSAYHGLSVYDASESHLRICLDIRQRLLGEDHAETLTAKNLLGMTLTDMGKYDEAEPYLRQALAGALRDKGDKHRNTLSFQSNLAKLLYHRGKLSEAQPLFAKAIELSRTALGVDDSLTLTLMGNYAMVLREQGKLAEAEDLCRKVLESEQRIWGPNHPYTLIALNNLAQAEAGQGKLRDAEKLFREMLDSTREVFGEKHVRTLGAMNNLAVYLDDQEKWAEAEKLHRQVIVLAGQIEGQEHPSTLRSMNNLAMVLTERGKLDEADDLSREALEISIRVLGETHSRTLSTMRNRAGVLLRRGKLPDAEELFQKVHALQNRVLGPDHPDTLLSMMSLANALNKRGKFTEAEPLARAALEGQRRLLLAGDARLKKTSLFLVVSLVKQGKRGEAIDLLREVLANCQKLHGAEHKETLYALTMLAVVLRDHGQLAEAEDLSRKSWDMAPRFYAEDDDKYLYVLSNLATVLRMRGKSVDAEPLLRKAHELSVRNRGEDHPQTLVVLNNLAIVLANQGRHGEAEPIYRKGLELERRVLGDLHPSTLLSLYNLGLTLTQKKKAGEGEPLLRECLASRRKTLPSNHPLVAETLDVLSWCLLDLNRPEQAEELLKECQDIRQAILPKGAWLLAHTQGQIGRALAQQKRFEQAEPLLLDAYAALKDNPKAPQGARDEVLARVVGLYEAWGRVVETTHKGALSKKEAKQVHQVEVKAGRIYVLDMESSAFDTFLTLESSSGARLAENDDISATNLNSRILHVAAKTETCRIIATAFERGATGPYLLRVRELGVKKE